MRDPKLENQFEGGKHLLYNSILEHLFPDIFLFYLIVGGEFHMESRMLKSMKKIKTLVLTEAGYIHQNFFNLSD